MVLSISYKHYGNIRTCNNCSAVANTCLRTKRHNICHPWYMLASTFQTVLVSEDATTLISSKQSVGYAGQNSHSYISCCRVSVEEICFATIFAPVAYRGGIWGVNPPPPRNSEGPPKSCQTHPDCENS